MNGIILSNKISSTETKDAKNNPLSFALSKILTRPSISFSHFILRIKIVVIKTTKVIAEFDVTGVDGSWYDKRELTDISKVLEVI